LGQDHGVAWRSTALSELDFGQKFNGLAMVRRAKYGAPKLAKVKLRVVTLEDGETVHNAFFDRNFRENQR
jgi:hypothetical protein